MPQVTNPHTFRYRQALRSYTEARGIEPDRHWKSMLYLLTVMPGLWRKAEPYIDFADGSAYLANMAKEVDLTGGEIRLVRLATNLFNESQCEAVNMGDVIDTLDKDNWQAVIEALQIRRGES